MGKYFNYYKTYKKKPKMTRYRLIKNKKVTGSLKNTSNTINLPARTSSLTSNRSVSYDLTTAIDSTNFQYCNAHNRKKKLIVNFFLFI